MAMTIQQLQDFSNTFPELRWLTEKIIDYLEANQSSGGEGSSYLTFDSIDGFPEVGETNKIYGALDTNNIYLWSTEIEWYVLQTFKLESYQNSSMSDPVLAFVYRDAEGNIRRVYELIANNDIMRGGESYAETIDAFPFDNINWHDVTARGGKFLNKHSGSFVANTTIENGATIDFDNKINSRIDKSYLGQSSVVIFAVDNADTVIELTLMPTAQIIAGGTLEAVTINAGGSVRGDSGEFFTSVIGCIIGNNAQVKPGTTNSFGLSKCTIGNYADITVGGDMEGITIDDNVTMTTVAGKTNKKFFNDSGTVYETGVSGGNVTATAV